MDASQLGPGDYSNPTALETLQQSYSTELLWTVELAPGWGPGGGVVHSQSCIFLRHLNTGHEVCMHLRHIELYSLHSSMNLNHCV